MKLVIAPNGLGKTFVVHNNVQVNVAPAIQLKNLDEYQPIRDVYRDLAKLYGRQWFRLEEARRAKRLALADILFEEESQSEIWLTADVDIAKYVKPLGVWRQSADFLFLRHLAEVAEAILNGNPQPVYSVNEIQAELRVYEEFAASERIPISNSLNSLVGGEGYNPWQDQEGRS